MGTCPGPSIITWTSYSQAFFVSSPSVLQLGELGLVAGVGQAAGPQAVAQREADVVLLEDLADVVEALVEQVLPVVLQHPLGQDRARRG